MNTLGTNTHWPYLAYLYNKHISVFHLFSFLCWIVFHCIDMKQVIHSPVGGQLLVSSLGLLMNKAAIINEQGCYEYICAHHVWAYVFGSLGQIRGALQGRMISACLTLWELPKFSRVTIPFCIPANHVGESDSPTSSLTLDTVSPSSGWEMVSRCGFGLHFPSD